MKQTIQEVKQFIDNGYEIQNKAKEMCVQILKEELGGSVEFDWQDGDAPAISSITFDDDLTDAYITKIYFDGDILKVDLYAYYIGRNAVGISLSDEYETNYLGILDYLNNLREDDPKPVHRIIDSCFGEVMLRDEKIDSDGSHYCQIYGGDNYDDYIGEVNCSLNDDDDIINQQIEEKLL